MDRIVFITLKKEGHFQFNHPLCPSVERVVAIIYVALIFLLFFFFFPLQGGKGCFKDKILFPSTLLRDLMKVSTVAKNYFK